MKPATTLIIGASILATTAVALPTVREHPDIRLPGDDSTNIKSHPIGSPYFDYELEDPNKGPFFKSLKQDKQPKQDINRTSASGKENDDAGKKEADSSKKGVDSNKKGDAGKKKGDDSTKKGDDSTKKGDDSTKKGDDSTKKGDDSTKSADAGKGKADTGKRADEFAVEQLMKDSAKNKADNGKRADEFGVNQRMEETAKDRIIDWAHVE